MTPGHIQQARDIEGWRRIIGSAFGALDIAAREDRPFHGRFRFMPLGDLIVAEVNSANESARRTRHHIAHDSEEAFAFAFTRRGSMDVSQFGRTQIVPADCFTLLDLNSPYSLVHADETDLVTLKIPAAVLRARIPEPGHHVLEIYPAASGVARISRNLLFSLAAECGKVPGILAGAYAARVADMFSMLVDAGATARGGRRPGAHEAAMKRCMAFIESRLADPGLGPAAVANAAGISVRYLHKLFAGSGESVGECIRRQRLEKCRRELCDPSRRSCSIKAIAMNGGFASAAHFSNAFREAYGQSPQAARKGALP